MRFIDASDVDGLSAKVTGNPEQWRDDLLGSGDVLMVEGIDPSRYEDLPHFIDWVRQQVAKVKDNPGVNRVFLLATHRKKSATGFNNLGASQTDGYVRALQSSGADGVVWCGGGSAGAWSDSINGAGWD